VYAVDITITSFQGGCGIFAAAELQLDKMIKGQRIARLLCVEERLCRGEALGGVVESKRTGVVSFCQSLARKRIGGFEKGLLFVQIIFRNGS